MLALLLGHSVDMHNPVLSFDRQQRVDRLLQDLQEIDEMLKNALRDSMAVEVGELTVNYGNHIAQLKNEGSTKLRELSVITGIPLLFDKYSGRGANDGNGSRTVYSLRRLL